MTQQYCKYCGEPFTPQKDDELFCRPACEYSESAERAMYPTKTLRDEIVFFLMYLQPKLVKDMQECYHDHGDPSDPNPFHGEGSVWAHTMMAMCNVPRGDANLLVSALLHDIGKPACRFVQDVTNFIFFTGHELHSARIAKKFIGDFEVKFKIDPEMVLRLIADHGDLYRLTRDELVKKYKGEQEYFSKLVQLVRADTEGAISSTGGLDMSIVRYVKKRI